jgi:general secretion pathway protein L
VLAEFLTWWRQHLLELVPEALLRGTGPAANALVVDATNPGVLTVIRRRRGAETRITQQRLDDPGLLSLRAALNDRAGGESVLLRLASAVLLERTVPLPLAAERDLDRVLTYDMERLTPFSAEEVFWAYAVEARDRARARLQVRLTIIPKVSVQEVIDLLSSCAGRPNLIEAATDSGARIIRLQHERAAGRIAQLSPRNAAVVLAALAGLLLISPFVRQSLEMADAQAQLDALAPRIKQVNALRNRISGVGAGGDAVASETKRLGDMMEALAAVTEILPNDSYLTEFEMRERKLSLSGQSASAPKLISLLSADERIRNPSFTAPVTKSPDNKRDVFAISAELAQ